MTEEDTGIKADEQVARQAASQVADDQREGIDEDANFVEFRNGLKLGVREVPPMILRKPLEHLPEPQPPKIPLPEKGEGIEEPNPNDPSYIDAHASWEITVGLAVMDTMLLLGTTEPTPNGEPRPLILHCPDNLLRPEDEGWVSWLEAANVVVDKSTSNTRYLCWLRYYAVSNASDLSRLSSAIAGKSGVREEDVALAASAFPGDETRGANSESAPKTNRANRRAIQRTNSRARP